MPARRTPQPCACGCTYEAFRIGISFADARRMLHNVPDPNRPGWWRQKRRHCVLGFLRELKLDYWQMIHGGCAAGMLEAA